MFYQMLMNKQLIILNIIVHYLIQIDNKQKMISKAITILCLVIVINSARLHSLRSQLSGGQTYDVQIIHTSNRQILKFSSTRQVELLTVPDGYQYFNYSSGQCCLETIFNYYQFPTDASAYREDFFYRDADFDENNFTSPHQLVEEAQLKISKEASEDKRNALELAIKENIPNRDLQKFIDNEVPIILLITKGNQKSGHYVVLIGYDSENYYFQDPFTIRSISYLSKAALDSSWKAYIPSEKRWANRLGIIIAFKNARKRLLVPTVRPLP